MSDSDPPITFEEIYPTTIPYQPHRDKDWRVNEELSSYVSRMKSGLLPNWPEELLTEWLHRHASNMEDYAFLGFENLQFRLDTWDLEQFPGREAFRDLGFSDSFQNVEVRAEQNEYDWLAHYMLREGTWNTPIVLFDNRNAGQARLRTPFHLLEGHRRLSFLRGLKRLGKARPQHAVWLASL